MGNLANLNKSIIPLSEWSTNLETVVITFDDGFLDTLQIAAPILASHKMPFTVFVSPKLTLFLWFGHVSNNEKMSRKAQK